MRILVVVALVVGICLTGVAAWADSQVVEYQRGFADGQREGTSDVSWIHAAYGFFTVGIHTLFVLVTPGKEVPFRKLILLEGEPQSYKYGFMDGYKDGYKRQRTIYSASGALAILILSVVGQVAN